MPGLDNYLMASLDNYLMPGLDNYQEVIWRMLLS